MKKAMDFYLNKVKENNALIEQLENKIIELDAGFNFEKLMNLRRVARETGNDADLIAYEHERDKKNMHVGLLSDKIYHLKIENALLKNNAFNAFIDSSLPTICEILSKYENKPVLGDATKKKLYDEIKSATNTCFYYAGGYNNYFSISSLENDFNYKFSAKDGVNMTNNKLAKISLENINVLWISRAGIIEDTKTYANKLINQKKAISELSEKLFDLISEYNQIKTDYIPECAYISKISNSVL